MSDKPAWKKIVELGEQAMKEGQFKRLPVREACRRHIALDGADAQALEHALTITEKERDEARTLVERWKQAVIKYGELQDKLVVYEDRYPPEDFPYDRPDWIKVLTLKLIKGAVAMRQGDLDAIEKALGPKEKP